MSLSLKKIENGMVLGAFWLLSLKFCMRGIGIISTFVLVRLLSPEDFGLNAIAMSIFGMVEVLSRFGFDTVLIQKQDADRVHYDTAWTFNICFGLLACLTTLSISSVVAKFYADARLLPIMVCISVLFLLNGFMNVGIVDFRKNLTFEKEFTLQIVPKIISFCVTMIIAYYYRSYWALVVGSMVWKGLICLMSYIMCPYRPRFSFKGWNDLFDFSKWIFVGNLIGFFNTKTPELFIGKIISTAAVGYVSVSIQICDFCTSELVSNVNRAVYPGYSKVSSDLNQLKHLYIKVMTNISFWAFPLGAGLSSVASLLVPVVLGSQWVEATPLIEFLAISSLVFSLNSNSAYIFLALAKPKTNVIILLIRVIIFLPILMSLLFVKGILGAAYAALIASLLTFFMYNIVITKCMFLTFYETVEIYLRPFASTVIMYICVIYLKSILEMKGSFSDISTLVLSIFFGILIYMLTTIILWVFSGSKNGPEKSILLLLKKRFT